MPSHLLHLTNPVDLGDATVRTGNDGQIRPEDSPSGERPAQQLIPSASAVAVATMSDLHTRRRVQPADVGGWFLSTTAWNAVHHGGGLRGGHRRAEEEALAQFTTRCAQPFELSARFDPFGEHGYLELIAERDDCLQE